MRQYTVSFGVVMGLPLSEQNTILSNTLEFYYLTLVSEPVVPNRQKVVQVSTISIYVSVFFKLVIYTIIIFVDYI